MKKRDVIKIFCNVIMFCFFFGGTFIKSIASTEIPEWDSTIVYDYGDQVVYNDDLYEAKWWTQGFNPSTEVNNEWETPWSVVEVIKIDPNNPTTITGDGYVLIPLSQEETNLLASKSNESPLLKLANVVSAMPVKISLPKNGICVQFTNSGFIFDFIDRVETNLLIWHSQNTSSVIGYRMVYYKLPHGSWKTNPVFVANWHKAQCIGGYYIDGFGKEMGIGTASPFIYN